MNMCRSSKDKGGMRRCDKCNNPVERSSRNKAINALNGFKDHKITTVAINGNIKPSCTVDSLMNEWNPDAINHFAETMTPDSTEAFILYEDAENTVPKSIDEFKKKYELIAKVYDQEGNEDFLQSLVREQQKALDLYESTGLSKKNLTIAIGASVAAEAERRCGISVEAIENKKANKDQINKEYNERLLRTLEEKENILRQTDEWKDHAKKTDLYNQAVDEEGSTKAKLTRRRNAANEAFYQMTLTDKFKDYQEAQNAISDLEILSYKGLYAGYDEDLKTLSESYVSVLSDVRSMGGTIEIDSGSDKELSESLMRASRYYPTDWIEASNNHRTDLSIVAGESNDGEDGFYESSLFNDGDKMRKIQISTHRIPYSDTHEDKFMPIVIHEMFHRFEDTVPGIISSEGEFFRSRTKDEEESVIGKFAGGSKQITGKPDHFVTSYMGREYGGYAYEVGSVGVESIFGGNHGGLVGLDSSGRTHADEDTRSFVLGLLATAGRPRKTPQE